MKIRMEPLDAILNDAGKIKSLVWRGRQYAVVETQNDWKWRGEWWMTPDLRGKRRHYFQVKVKEKRAASETIWEIFSEDGQWTLSRELD